MKKQKLTKLEVVKQMNLQKDFKVVLNFLENTKKELMNNQNVKIKKIQEFIIEKQQYVKYCELEENKIVVEKVDEILKTKNKKDFLKYIEELEKEIIKVYGVLNKKINEILTYNNVGFQVNQYYDIKCFGFFEIYQIQNNKSLKPQDIEMFFKCNENEMLNLKNILSSVCDLCGYDQCYLGKENFPSEMQMLGEICFEKVKNNYNRIYLLLQEKYELKVLINRQDNSLVGYGIECNNHKGKNFINENGNVNYKEFANGLLNCQYVNETMDFEKVVCYLLNNKFNEFENDNNFKISEVEGTEIEFIDKTLSDDVGGATFNKEARNRNDENGFYFMLPKELIKFDDVEKVQQKLMKKYVIQKVFNKIHKGNVCYFVNKK